LFYDKSLQARYPSSEFQDIEAHQAHQAIYEETIDFLDKTRRFNEKDPGRVGLLAGVEVLFGEEMACRPGPLRVGRSLRDV
jgi:hypothetical protein